LFVRQQKPGQQPGFNFGPPGVETCHNTGAILIAADAIDTFPNQLFGCCRWMAIDTLCFDSRSGPASLSRWRYLAPHDRLEAARPASVRVAE
jgi:hypothetical protein